MGCTVVSAKTWATDNDNDVSSIFHRLGHRTMQFNLFFSSNPEGGYGPQDIEYANSI